MMRKLIPLLIFSLLLHAQEGDELPLQPPPPPPVDSQWQNWVFAATAIVTVATGVYVVSIHDGKKAP